MNNQPTVLEFFGPPGVGKTTLAYKIHNKLKGNLEVTFFNVPKKKYKRIFLKSFLFGKFMLTHPLQTLNIAKIIKCSKQKSNRDLIGVLFNHVYLMGFYSTLKTNTITILDQGLAQSIWSIKLNATSELTKLNKLFSINYVNICYIQIDAPYEEIVKRLVSRKDKINRIQKDKQSMRKLKSNFNKISKFIQIEKQATVIHIDNSYNLEKTINHIQPSILEYFTKVIKAK